MTNLEDREIVKKIIIGWAEMNLMKYSGEKFEQTSRRKINTKQWHLTWIQEGENNENNEKLKISWS